MRRTLRWSGGLLVALAAIGSCGKDKTTALDIKLEITGALDQVRIDTVSLDGRPVSLTGEMTTLFPPSPRMLKTGDVLTVWFLDSEDTKMVVVSATGRLCGRDASGQATTPARALAKGQAVPTTLALANNGTVCAGTGTGGAGGGGGTGAAGTSGSGTAGAGGAAGTGGTAGTGGGVGGSAGTSGGAGGAAGTTGSSGIGGAAGRGGTTGSAGTGGAAGRGGTTGSAGAGGAAGRGGTTGSAGTGGAAGRGGTTGSAGTGGATGGAAGRGGTGGAAGSGGTGTPCATAPIPGVAQSIEPFSQTAGCGYTGGFQTVDFVAAPNDYFAYGSGVVFGNSANCGRCVELVRNSTPAKRVTVTLVGNCMDPACVANPNQARFQVSSTAYQLLAPMNETSLPLPGEMLTYSFVPCQVNSNQQILANIKISGGAAATVLFVQQRYGIASATVEDVTTAQQVSLARGNDAYWRPPAGMVLPPSARFRLTDVNNATVTSGIFTTSNTPAFATAGTQFPACTSP